MKKINIGGILTGLTCYGPTRDSETCLEIGERGKFLSATEVRQLRKWLEGREGELVAEGFLKEERS